MGIGAAAYGIGLWIHWEAKHSNWIEWLAAIAFIGFLGWMAYRWRNEDGTKLKRKGKNTIKSKGTGILSPICPVCKSDRTRPHPSNTPIVKLTVCDGCGAEWITGTNQMIKSDRTLESTL